MAMEVTNTMASICLQMYYMHEYFSCVTLSVPRSEQFPELERSSRRNFRFTSKNVHASRVKTQTNDCSYITLILRDKSHSCGNKFCLSLSMVACSWLLCADKQSSVSFACFSAHKNMRPRTKRALYINICATVTRSNTYKARGWGGTSYKWANGDVPLDGVAFSRQD